MIRERLQSAVEKRPFLRLARHFFDGFFDADLMGGDDGARLGIGGLLAVLAVPGAAMSLVLIGKYSSLMRWFQRNTHFDPVAASLPDKYTFLAFSMMITGLVTIWKWDSLFPDRRDYANLAPLPLSPVSIFFAKLLALASFLCVFILDVNLVSSILFPLIVMEDRGTWREVLQFLSAHAISVAAASLFTFCSLLGGIGLLMAVLPYAVFRRITRYVQFACAAILLLLFFSVPAVAPALGRMTKGGEPELWRLPSVWFLSLYSNLQGQGDLEWGPAAGMAVRALCLSMGVAAVAYAVSYRRFFLRTAETPELAMTMRRLPEWIFRVLDRTLLRTPFERACFRFGLRTLFRSDRHCAIVAGALGLGAALAVQLAAGRTGRITPAELSAAPTILYFLITSVRFSFGIPSEIRSNWIFSSAPAQDGPGARRVARRILWAVAVPPLAAAFLLHSMTWGLAIGLVHLAYVSGLSALLVETVLIDYGSVPYTLAALPGRGNFVLAIALYATAYVFFAQGLAHLEYWIMDDPPRWMAAAFLGGLAGLGLWHAQDSEVRSGLEEPDEVVLLLRLSE